MESVDEALKKIDSGGYDNILSDHMKRLPVK